MFLFLVSEEFQEHHSEVILEFFCHTDFMWNYLRVFHKIKILGPWTKIAIIASLGTLIH